MKKIILFGRENSSLELSALFLFVLVLVGNLVVIKFAEGYYGYFDVSLGFVNFTPQMYDYVRIALPVMIASIIVTLTVVLLIKVSSFVGEFIAGKTQLNKKSIRYVKRHKKFFEGLIKILDFVFVALIVGVTIWVSYSFTTGLAEKLGEESAGNMTKLNSISKPGDNLQEIIIYKGNDEIITKKYDTSKKEFLDDYQVNTANNYQVRYINK